MTITGTEGPNHGRTFPAIYELKGDTLRICYDLSGAKRPTEFKSIPAHGSISSPTAALSSSLFPPDARNASPRSLKPTEALAENLRGGS